MQIELHQGQSQIVNDLFVEKSCRYAVVNASRGFGKSYLAATTAMIAVQELMELPPEVPNKNVALIAPTYSQMEKVNTPLRKAKRNKPADHSMIACLRSSLLNSFSFFCFLILASICNNSSQ